MGKLIQSFNATEEVYEKIQEVRINKKNVSAFINKCIVEYTKPKIKPRVELSV